MHSKISIAKKQDPYNLIFNLGKSIQLFLSIQVLIILNLQDNFPNPTIQINR